MTVSLFQVLAAAERRAAPLTGECAGYLILAAADHMVRSPCSVAAQQVHLEDTGAVRIAGGDASNAQAAETALRGLLDALMLEARSGSAALTRIGRRKAVGDISSLVRELEVALIPANRAAAQRSLARLYRETARAVQAAGGELAHSRPAQPNESSMAKPAPHGAADGLVNEAPKALEQQPRETQPAEPSSVIEQLPSQAPAVVASNPHAGQLPPAQPEALRERPDPGDIEAIDVEFSPVPPALAALSEVAPKPVQPAFEAFSGRDYETPAEPVVRRRASSPPSYVPEIPDIHKTPYLGTVVAPVSDVLAYRGYWPNSLGRAGSQSRVDAIPELEPSENPNQSASSERADEAATDPMPPLEEWLDSDELEDLDCHVDEATADAPLVQPNVAASAEPGPTAAQPGVDTHADVQGAQRQYSDCIQPTMIVAIEEVQGGEPSPPDVAFGATGESLVAQGGESGSAESPMLWTPPDVELGPVQPAPARFAAPESNVSELLVTFQVQASESSAELVRTLKELAGISATPPPVRVFEVTQVGRAHSELEENLLPSESSVRRANG